MKLGEVCGKCKLEAIDSVGQYSAVDPCLGILPGVKFACCGHGESKNIPYVVFTNGAKIYFQPYEIQNEIQITVKNKRELNKALEDMCKIRDADNALVTDGIGLI